MSALTGETEFLTVAEFAARLRVSEPTVYRRVADGTLPVVRLSGNGAIRIPASALGLTAWQLADAKRPRPEPTAPAIEREIEEKKADRDAANAAVERVYEDKARFVERHRRRLVGEADKATQAARDRYAGAIEEAEAARNELIDSRAASLWASLYPGELANEAPGDTAALALNLRRPIEAALGVTTRLAAGGVFEVLRRDSDYLAQAMTRKPGA